MPGGALNLFQGTNPALESVDPRVKHKSVLVQSGRPRLNRHFFTETLFCLSYFLWLCLVLII